MSDASEAFKVRINGGPVQDLVTSTGKYMYAALLAVLQDDDLLPLPDHEEQAIHVEIWCERLTPKYGPYHYLVWEDCNYAGQIHVAHAVPKQGPKGNSYTR